MKLACFFSVCCILLSATGASAQKLTADELVKAWKAGDISQTKLAEETYDDLKKNYHQDTFSLRLRQLNDYLQRHPDTRLRARILIYEQLGKGDVPAGRIKAAMQETVLLGDKQLLSELYSLYAEHSGTGSRASFYLLKTLEIQEKIGVQHFPHIYLRYLIIATWLYHTTDYRHSVDYGLKGLALIQLPKDYLLDYILLLDIVGASYRELQMPDSSIFYYQKIKQVLADYDARPAFYAQIKTMEPSLPVIWNGIAGGGIAKAWFLQQKYDEAIPLLEQNIASSTAYKQYGDAAMAQNTLAAIWQVHRKYSAALAAYRSAYQWALQAGDIKNTMLAAKGMAAAFSKINRYDSAYFYQAAYQQWKDSLQQTIAENRLATVSMEVEYDRMQTAIVRAQYEAGRQLRIRNTLLAGIAVLSVITILLYNRRRLRQKVRQQKLEKEKRLAEAEAAHAQEQLATFTRSMAEKNKLIESLQAQFARPDAAVLKDFIILTDDDWRNFKTLFNKVHPDFLHEIEKALPDITAAETRFLALCKLNIPTKEMAAMQGISVDAVRKQRHRLRKKLEISPLDVALEDFVSGL
ncbi:helix-turn-helix transcriptional regulator [Niabella aquatica]